MLRIESGEMSKILISLLATVLSAAAFAQKASISSKSNLRSAPSTEGKIIGHLQAGTVVTIISKYLRLGYVRVETVEGRTGWVYNTHLTELEVGGNTKAENRSSVLSETAVERVGGPEIYPDQRLTPGKPDPSVTQASIAKNICKKGWSTDSVRPAESVTNKIKSQTLNSYGLSDPANHYELDHLISLQNGGCPDCIENLWPEAYGDRKHPMTQNDRAQWNKRHPGSAAVLPGALEKDMVENHVHDEICFGIPNAKLSTYAKKYPAKIAITLERGQQILAADWYACYRNMLDGNRPCE